MEMESCVPPGFRFHPTEEELVGYYLKRKVNSLKIDLDVIVDIDLYRMEPWDIQGTYVRNYRFINFNLISNNTYSFSFFFFVSINKEKFHQLKNLKYYSYYSLVIFE